LGFIPIDLGTSRLTKVLNKMFSPLQILFITLQEKNRIVGIFR
jgi:hypothetical protein